MSELESYGLGGYNQRMIVMKFGGSSVANAQRIERVAGIVAAYKDSRPVVVLSAMGDTTDHLLEAAEGALEGRVDVGKVEQLHTATARALGIDSSCVFELIGELKSFLTGVSMIHELSRRSRDYLVSFGERLSARIMASYLCKLGIASQAFDAWDVGFTSDSNYGAAELLSSVWEDVPRCLAPYTAGRTDAIPVVTGFIAKDKSGVVTTLGRGGSDLTATMIGAAAGASEIQTWKDVDGILTADPKIVPQAKPVDEVTYEEAQELAIFGSQVLHPRSMIPCRKKGVPVRVKNSYNIESRGTLIVESHTKAVPLVTAITKVKDVSLIDIQSSRMLGASGFLAHIFNQFLKWNISIDVIATSEVSLSLTVDGKAELSGLLEDLRRVADVSVKERQAIITIICDASRSSEIIARAFGALAEAGINVQMISHGASKVNISFLVENTQADQTIRVVHSKLFA